MLKETGKTTTHTQKKIYGNINKRYKQKQTRCKTRRNMHITPTLHQHYTNSAHGCKHVTHMPLSVIPLPVSSMTPVGDLIHPQIANLHHGINPSKSQKKQTNCSMAEIDPNNITKPLNHWIWCWFIFHKIPAQHIRWPKRTVQPSHARRTKVHTLALVHLSEAGRQSEEVQVYDGDLL